MSDIVARLPDGSRQILKPGTQLHFRSVNPKVTGSKAAARYEQYKNARTVRTALSRGAWTGDLRFDVQRGYATLVTGKLTTLKKLKTYIISLKRRPDRLERIKQAANSLGLDWEVLPAVDGRVLRKSTGARCKKINKMACEMTYTWRGKKRQRPLRMKQSRKVQEKWGLLGCTISHAMVMRKILCGSHEHALILEDDPRLNATPENTHKTFEAGIAAANEAVPDWNVLYLGGKVAVGTEQPRGQKPEDLRLRKRGPLKRMSRALGIWQAHAYIVKRNKTCINAILKHQDAGGSSDGALTSYQREKKGDCIMFSHPQLFYQPTARERDSDIYHD